jgi:hypothetical protein
MRSPKKWSPDDGAERESPRQPPVRKGDRVEVTKWTPHPTGRVANVYRGSVFVKYDNSFVEDELDPCDVRVIEAGQQP